MLAPSRACSYPCGNFSDTSGCILLRPKGWIGHTFTVCIRTENENQASFSPFWSTWDFCSCRTHLRTPVLSFNRCAAPAKLSTWLCSPRMTLREMEFHFFLFFVCLFSFELHPLGCDFGCSSVKMFRKLHIALKRLIVKRTILKLFCARWSGPGKGCFCSKLSPGSWSPLF